MISVRFAFYAVNHAVAVTCPADFWAKLTTCWFYFNLVRPNRGKEWQSPLQLLQARAPSLTGTLLNWRPLNLAKRHHFYLPKPYHRGHDVPSFPQLACSSTRLSLAAGPTSNKQTAGGVAASGLLIRSA